jgi:hypothetical protein
MYKCPQKNTQIHLINSTLREDVNHLKNYNRTKNKNKSPYQLQEVSYMHAEYKLVICLRSYICRKILNSILYGWKTNMVREEVVS